MDPAVVTVYVDAPKVDTTETFATGNSGEKKMEEKEENRATR